MNRVKEATNNEYKVCGRCGGSGRHSYNLKDGSVCYGCGGSGKVASLPEGMAKKFNVTLSDFDGLSKKSHSHAVTFNGDKCTAKYVSGEGSTAKYLVTNTRTGTGFKLNLSTIEKYFTRW